MGDGPAFWRLQRQAGLIWQGQGNAALAIREGVLAVVDGIFYNPEELEGEPKEGPAEQLVATYRRLGLSAALGRINGDFALALYDADKETLWLARDRVGHRPLYYVEQSQGLAFASRPSALFSFPGVDREPNRRYVAVFAGSHYRYIDNRPDESPFKDIKQLPAATFIEIRADSRRVERYWTLQEEPDWADDEATLAARYRALLMDSVRRRLAVTARQAFTLSGGLDSSSVLACAVDLTGRRQNAFSSVYSDKTYDESEDIKGFVQEKVKQWHAVPIEGFDLFATVRAMVRAHDEPVATATWLSHFLLCQEVAKQGVDTLFGGLGGDELNAGEYEYFIFHFADLDRRGERTQLAHEIDTWARHHDHPIYRKNAEVAKSLLDRLTDPTISGRVCIDKSRLARYSSVVRRDYFDLSGLEPVLDHPFSSWLKNRTCQDIFRETAPCCLRAEDRDCSAFGLAHMDPFFDHRLIEFMFRVPGYMKIRNGVTKQLLREAMKGVLPEETRTRIKKTGWNAPAHLWFVGEGLQMLNDLVHSRAFKERGIYNMPQVSQIIDEHQAIVASGEPIENHMMFLWQLLNLELWFEEVIDRQPARAS
ncbi:MAG: asparagine synthase [Nitrospira sp. CG24E]|nr:MAG: asparagine synthase [Nitrospira sp. CG24E]